MTQVRKKPPATPRLAAACCSPLDDLLDPDLFRALCDPTRALLLACLAKCARPCSVSEIAQCCAVDLSVVSRHLAQLEQAGVLDSTRHGRTVLYAVRFHDLCRLLRDLAAALEACRSSSPGACCAPARRPV